MVIVDACKRRSDRTGVFDNPRKPHLIRT
jgi:hypothetical protein